MAAKKILMIVGDYVEDYEVMVPFQALLTVGYAVVIADVNDDGKPDIVVVDSKRVIWYENPSWKCRTIITGKTKPDNVCIAPLDIDGVRLTALVAPQ